MTAAIVQLDPHTNMTVREVLELQTRNAAELDDVIIVGFDLEGDVFIRSSHISRERAVWLLLAAIEQIRHPE